MVTTSMQRPGEVLLRLRTAADPARVQNFCEEYDAELLGSFQLPSKQTGDAIVHLKLDDEMEALKKLRRDPRVSYAEPNYLVKEFSSPNDLDPRLWGLQNLERPGQDISAVSAWEIQHGGGGPLVAVLDSGCDYNHPDLDANVWRNPGEIAANGIDDDGNGVVDDLRGYNAARKTGDPMDDRSHGTHVCGTIGAVGNNGQGVVGVNWHAQLMPVKFLEGGYGDTADAIEGLLYADKMGARLTSNSWGGVNYSQALYDVLASSPALHVCAAGNDHANNDVATVYPAGYDLPNVLAVAATDSQDQLASFSNYGATTVHVAAPGDKIFSTMPGNQLGYKSGTSMATPHVSGLASLIATEYPDISNAALKDRLVFGTDRLPALEGRVVSGGRINAARALENDLENPGPVTALQLVAQPTSTGVPLQWLAAGDDGPLGQATAYELRYSDRPIQTEEDFQAAVPALAPAPLGSGQLQAVALKIQPRAEEHTLHVALRAVDNVGQRSLLTGLEVTVPAAKVAFAGDVWNPTGTWGLQNVAGRGPVWTDSPGADYAEGENSSLTSRQFSLRDFQTAKLAFECKHDLEKSFDRITLEITRDGQKWEKLDHYEGRIGWEERSYDLSSYCGGDAQLRFSFKTDLDVCKDGFYLDKLVVTGDTHSR